MTPTIERILVVANETASSAVLVQSLAGLVGSSDVEVLTVAPALSSRLAYWTSGDDAALRAAEHRLARSIELLTSAGIRAEGLVGDANPLQAITDALALFPADHIVIATHPENRSNWLARNIVTRAREQFVQPILHIVVDAERRREYLIAA